MRIRYTILSVILASMLCGCGTVKGIFGKASVNEGKSRAKIVMVENSISKVNVERLTKIGEYSYGISLVTNTPVITKNLNERISSLANQPSQEAKKSFQLLVAQSVTNNNALLLKKDLEIRNLQQRQTKLIESKDAVIGQYMELASNTALQSDTYQSKLSQMDSWGGLGAIWYGLKRLVVRMMWGIGIFSIIFIVLRVLSVSNPMAAGIFGIFNVIGSWVVNIIQVLVPKAVSLAGNVSSSIFNAYKSTLTKVIDAIQMARNNSKDGTVDMKSILNDVSKSMNDDEKTIVNELKRGLNWK